MRVRLLASIGGLTSAMLLTTVAVVGRTAAALEAFEVSRAAETPFR
jgi:hypothetical protein